MVAETFCNKVYNRPRMDSNLRPAAWKPDALLTQCWIMIPHNQWPNYTQCHKNSFYPIEIITSPDCFNVTKQNKFSFTNPVPTPLYLSKICRIILWKHIFYQIRFQKLLRMATETRARQLVLYQNINSSQHATSLYQTTGTSPFYKKICSAVDRWSKIFPDEDLWYQLCPGMHHHLGLKVTVTLRDTKSNTSIVDLRYFGQ